MSTVYLTIRVRKERERDVEEMERKLRLVRVLSVVAAGVLAFLLSMLLPTLLNGQRQERQYEPASAAAEETVQVVRAAETAEGITTAAVASNPAKPRTNLATQYPNPWGLPLFSGELASLYEVCERRHMAPELGAALLWQECGFRRGEDGALEVGLEESLDRLGQLLEEYDDLEGALCAYRWGSDTGDRAYSGQVLDKLERLGAECW